MLTLIGIGSASASLAQCVEDRLSIVGAKAEAVFTVAVADDPAERAQGLMHVESMPTLSGMIFVYEAPSHASFWMRNTLIPLDMLFADETGVITRIHPMAIPLDETPIDGGQGVKFVLEINGGLAARLGLQEGDVMHHPSIGNCS